MSKLKEKGYGAGNCGCGGGAVNCGNGGGGVNCGKDWGIPGNIIFLFNDVAAYCGLIYDTSPVGIYDGIVGIFNESKLISFYISFSFFGFIGGGWKSFLITILMPFEGLIFIFIFLVILL